MTSAVFRTSFELGRRIGWFPGHMAKAMRTLEEKLKDAHMVVEVRDARIPLSSANPELDRALGGKPRVVVLNKADLVPQGLKTAVEKTTSCKGVFFTHSTAYRPRDTGLPRFISQLKDMLPSKFKTTPRVVLVIGMPNIGKSSLINKLGQKSSAKVGALPGVTRGFSGFRIAKDQPLYLLDSPGILMPNFDDDEERALKIALCGGIPDNVADVEYIADYLLYTLNVRGRLEYTKLMREPHPCDDIEDVLQSIEERLGKGNETHIRSNFHNSANFFLKRFRDGSFGPIVLDDVYSY